jgi:hypothetical protein
MTALARFLFPAPAERSAGAILRWWEARRLPYNLIVGGAGLFTLAVIRVVTWLPVVADGGFPPLVLIAVYGGLANLCYLMGPMVEIGLLAVWGRKLLPTGPALYRMGLTFSVGLTLLPALLVTVFAVLQVLMWIF